MSNFSNPKNKSIRKKYTSHFLTQIPQEAIFPIFFDSCDEIVSSVHFRIETIAAKGQRIPLGFHAVPSAFNDRSRSRAAVCKSAKSAWRSPSTKGKRMDCDSRASPNQSTWSLQTLLRPTALGWTRFIRQNTPGESRLF